MRRQLVALWLVLVVAAGIYAVATHRDSKSYTVSVAGVVTMHDSAVYTLDGRAVAMTVSFIADGAAEVGDLLLAGNGSPTWGYRAQPSDHGCWSIRATSQIEGAWIDANIGELGGTPGVDIHIRIPKADSFTGGLGSNGQVLGQNLCMDSTGRAISAD